MVTTFDTPIYDLLRMLFLLKNEARQKYKADLKGVFGSCVRGEQRPDSDVDILVEFDDGANLLDLTGLSLFLEEKLHRHIDVVPESAIRKEIKDSILQETVYL
ncbi:MAG: nucleotidyltransferase family protein [Nitrospirae bacterium]|nr:nucleotidyltransferase family protein [Nitrospirota bacterium]